MLAFWLLCRLLKIHCFKMDMHTKYCCICFKIIVYFWLNILYLTHPEAPWRVCIKQRFILLLTLLYSKTLHGWKSTINFTVFHIKALLPLKAICFFWKCEIEVSGLEVLWPFYLNWMEMFPLHSNSVIWWGVFLAFSMWLPVLKISILN